MAELTTEQIVEALTSMSLVELNELVSKLKEKVPELTAMPVGGVAMPAPGAVATEAAPEEVEEKTEFDVVLTGFTGQKIQVIKAVRELTTLGLKEAKEAVENAPFTVKEAVSKEEAEEAQAKLEEAGGTVEIR
ncbi:MAG TPA: 50S ribosomal protein L7/L12 [Armatimonadetes bacterium]|nr:50S ribosomal protein L7/L12 [Armatimonadota bacterium]